MSRAAAGHGPVPSSKLHPRSLGSADPSTATEPESLVDRDLIDRAFERPWYAPTMSHELERGYEAASRSARRKSLQVYLAFILIVIDVCFIFDVWADVAAEGAILRFGVVTPLILLVLWILRRDRDIPLESCLALVSVFTVVGTITFLGLATEPPYTEGYLMAAGMIGFAVNLSLPLRIQQAWMLYVGNVTTYWTLTMSGLVENQFSHTSILVLFFTSTMLATLRHAIRREQGSKNVYLFQLRERLQSRELARLVDELTRVADRDALTEIGNRRCFDTTLNRAWGDAAIEGGSVALAMIDIDHFKSFNDAAGHVEGDRCLRAVARALASSIRPEHDVPVRYGGEEFAVIMRIPGQGRMDASDLRTLGERMRRAVETLAIRHPGAASTGIVTVSVGVASAAPGLEGTGPGDLVVAADRALYRAKRTGRNTVQLEVRDQRDHAA